MLLEEFQGAHHAIEAGLPRFVDAIAVMQMARAIHGKAHQELAFGKKLTPLVVEQDAVGLQGIRNSLAAGVMLLKLYSPAKKIDARDAR